MAFRILFVGPQKKRRVLTPFRERCDDAVEIMVTDAIPQAGQFAGAHIPELLVVDIDSFGPDCLDFLRDFQKQEIHPAIVALVDKSPLSLSVQVMQTGVDSLFSSTEQHQFVERLLVLQQNNAARDRANGRFTSSQRDSGLTKIIGESAGMKKILNLLSRLTARKWVTILLCGETGSGKGLIANALHNSSVGEYRPFVEVNCSALPENLLESELFGYEKGAFTDARSSKKGLFELAQNGTLFLDEIGDISLNIQVKLLKALEHKKIRRLGGTSEIQVECRIIAATNRDLKAAISAGQFRSDLYYRLNLISLQLPPLRQRRDDIIALTEHFVQQFAKTYDSPIRSFTREALELLNQQHWPGNVRELSHVIERLALLCNDARISRKQLEEALDSDTPAILSGDDNDGPLSITIPEEGISLEEGEKFLIDAVLRSCNWNKTRTSKILKISRPRLNRKIERFNLFPPADE